MHKKIERLNVSEDFQDHIRIKFIYQNPSWEPFLNYLTNKLAKIHKELRKTIAPNFSKKKA